MKYTANQSFFLKGEVVEVGDVVELTNSEYIDCQSRVIEYREQVVADVESKSVKVTTRKAK